MVRRVGAVLALVIGLSLSLSVLGAGPALAARSMQPCSCVDEFAEAGQPVVFLGTAVGRVGELLSGPDPLDEWSFVVSDVYRGEVRQEQFVAQDPRDQEVAAASCIPNFERGQTYVVAGYQIPVDELPETILAISVVRATCASADSAIVDELGLVAQVPQDPPRSISGAGRLRPGSDDDHLDAITVLVFGGGALATAALVLWLWRRP